MNQNQDLTMDDFRLVVQKFTKSGKLYEMIHIETLVSPKRLTGFLGLFNFLFTEHWEAVTNSDKPFQVLYFSTKESATEYIESLIFEANLKDEFISMDKPVDLESLDVSNFKRI